MKSSRASGVRLTTRRRSVSTRSQAARKSSATVGAAASVSVLSHARLIQVTGSPPVRGVTPQTIGRLSPVLASKALGVFHWSASATRNSEAALQAEGTEWAKEALHGLHHGSPSAVMWSFEAMRRGAKLSLRGALAADLALTRAVSVHPEFHEGVRAMLVDKDRTPKWQPAHLADVDQAAIQALFA